jgi:hypothetical protein
MNKKYIDQRPLLHELVAQLHKATITLNKLQELGYKQRNLDRELGDIIDSVLERIEVMDSGN